MSWANFRRRFSAWGLTTEESNSKPGLPGIIMQPMATRGGRRVFSFWALSSSGTGATRTGSSARRGWTATTPSGPMSMTKSASAMAPQIPCDLRSASCVAVSWTPVFSLGFVDSALMTGVLLGGTGFWPMWSH